MLDLAPKPKIEHLLIPEKDRASFREGVNFKIVGFPKSKDVYTFIISEGNIAVGHLMFRYDHMFSTYYVYDLRIKPRFRSKASEYKPGHGFGSNLVRGLNLFLRQKKAIGHLHEGIRDPDKKDLYVRNGWKERSGKVGLYFDGTRV